MVLKKTKKSVKNIKKAVWRGDDSVPIFDCSV